MFDSWCQGLCHGGFDMSIYYWDLVLVWKGDGSKEAPPPL